MGGFAGAVRRGGIPGCRHSRHCGRGLGTRIHCTAQRSLVGSGLPIRESSVSNRAREGQRVNILLVNKYWRPFGGVEAHALVVEEMLQRHGHKVFHLSTQHADNWESDTSQHFVKDVDFRSGHPGQRLHAVGRAMFGRATVKSLQHILDEVRIDAVHVLHAYHQLGMQFMGELRRRNIPTVLSLHDYKVSCPNYRFFSERSGKLCTKCLDHDSGFVWAPATERCWSGSAAAGVFLSLEAVVNASRKTYAKDPGAVIYLNNLQRESLLARG